MMFKGYRTVLFNVLSAVAVLAETSEFTSIVPDEYTAYAALFVAVVNVALRFVTTTPLGKSHET